MKIAIFSDNFYPELSGISDSIVLLARELVRMGDEVHFFVPRYSEKNYQLAGVKKTEPDFPTGVYVHRLPSLPYSRSGTKSIRIALPTGVPFLKSKEKFDLVHSQSPFGAGLEGMAVAKMQKIPFIGTHHTPIEEFFQYLPWESELVSKLEMTLVSWYYSRCNFLTAPYQGLLQDLAKMGVETPSEVVSNPVDFSGFGAFQNKNKSFFKRKFQLSGEVMLYTGRLSPEKKVDVVIRSVAEIRKIFPKINLAITGQGLSERDLKDLVKKLGLQKNVRFFGRVNEKTLHEIYLASDVFAVMSTAESQCLSLMKAMAAELPVVVANMRALPDYVGTEKDNRGFVVPPNDYRALADKIVYLLKNKEQAVIMGKNGRQFVQKFSPDMIAAVWKKIYQDVIKKFEL